MRISDWSSSVCSSDLDDLRHADLRVRNADERAGLGLESRRAQPGPDALRLLAEPRVVLALRHRRQWNRALGMDGEEFRHRARTPMLMLVYGSARHHDGSGRR